MIYALVQLWISLACVQWGLKGGRRGGGEGGEEEEG